MAAATSSTEVFAFSLPIVKPGGEFEIAYRDGRGLVLLRAHRSVWRGHYEHLRKLFAPVIPPPGAPATPGKPARKTAFSRQAHPPAYEAMVAERAAGSTASWAALAKKHGVADVHRFYAWQHYRRTHAQAKPAKA